MAAVIQADVHGLQVMAARFGVLSGQVAAAGAPGGLGLLGQATAAAVATVDGGVAASGAVLGERAQMNAVKVTTGASDRAHRISPVVLSGIPHL